MFKKNFHLPIPMNGMVVLVLFVVILFQTATSFGASTRPAALAQSTYAGTWSGTTSQDKVISFTVAGDVITSITIAFELPACTITRSSTSNFFINGNSFTLFLDGALIQGTFTSSGSASGRADYINMTPECSGSVSATWSVTNTSPATDTPTPTTSSTASPTASTVPISTPSGNIYLPLVMKQLPPTSTPTPTATSLPTATLPSGEGSVWTISVKDAFQVAQLRCTQGINSYTITPKPGYALFILDLQMRNTQASTVSSNKIAVIDGNGTRSEVSAPEFSGSYCPSTFVTSYPAGDRSDAFAFVVSESMLGQPFKIVFADAAPVSFTVRR